MTDRIDALEKIIRLRKREIERCAQKAMAARQELAKAETAADEASLACSRAMKACDTALAEQRRRPTDPQVQLHCRVIAGTVARSSELRTHAGETLTQAHALVDQVKREWLRAQRRHDALVAKLDQALQQLRRRIARRLDDDLRPSQDRAVRI